MWKKEAGSCGLTLPPRIRTRSRSRPGTTPRRLQRCLHHQEPTKAGGARGISRSRPNPPRKARETEIPWAMQKARLGEERAGRYHARPIVMGQDLLQQVCAHISISRYQIGFSAWLQGSLIWLAPAESRAEAKGWASVFSRGGDPRPVVSELVDEGRKGKRISHPLETRNRRLR